MIVSRRVVLAGLAATVFAGCGTASHAADAARLLGDSTVGYRATRTVTAGGKTYVGPVYAMPGRQRHEQEINGFHPVVILRADRRVAWLVVEALGVYTEFPFPEAVTSLGGREALGPAQDHRVIAGQKSDRYRLENRGEDGSSLLGEIWFAPGDIVTRLEGTYYTTAGKPFEAQYELSTLMQGPQDLALFEIPKGLNKLPAEAVASLFRLKGAKPKP